MRHKVGDKVKIKSKEWYDNEPKDEYGVTYSCRQLGAFAIGFTKNMSRYCGRIFTIVDDSEDCYLLTDDKNNCIPFCWVDDMFEENI